MVRMDDVAEVDDTEVNSLKIWVRAMLHSGEGGLGATRKQPSGWHLVSGRLFNPDGREYEIALRRVK